MGCSSSAEQTAPARAAAPMKAPATSLGTVVTATTTFKFKEGKMDEATAMARAISLEMKDWKGAISMTISQVDATTAVGWAMYTNQEAMDRFAPTIKEKFAMMGPMFAEPPARDLGTVVFSSYDSGADVSKQPCREGLGTTTTTITLKEGTFDQAMALLPKLKDEVLSWDGFVGLVISKLSDTRMVAHAMYDNAAAIAANTDKFKAAMKGFGPLFAAPPVRLAATAVICSHGIEVMKGAPGIHMVFKVPGEKEEEVDAFWQSHQAWMRKSHKTGFGVNPNGPRILDFHIAKGKEPINPMDPTAGYTGKLVYVMSETYASGADVQQHLKQCGEEAPEVLKKLTTICIPKFSTHVDIGSVCNLTGLTDSWEAPIQVVGDPTIHIVLKVPKTLEGEMDAFWNEHEQWMRKKHVMSRTPVDGKICLTSFNIRKGPAMVDPMHPEKGATGELVYIMSESYVSGDEIKKHLDLCGKDMPEWFGKLAKYNEKYGLLFAPGTNEVITCMGDFE